MGGLTVVLIHGAHHGGWCWQKVVELLAAQGHRCVTPDLPSDDPAAGFAEYRQAALAAIPAGTADDELVVVGHSLGAYVAGLVAAQRPVARVVALCALPLHPGERVGAGGRDVVTAFSRTRARFLDADDRSMLSPSDFAALFYDGMDDREVLWALCRLRPQARTPMREPWPLQQWPEVPLEIVLAQDDRVIDVERGREEVQRLTGRAPHVVPGGHSVFVTQPARVARIVTGKDGTGW